VAGTYSYDAQFFDYLDRGSRRSAARMVPIVAGRLQPRSVLDVGCGRGIWIDAWTRAGIEDCLGVDGDYIDRRRLAIPRERFVARDLSRSFDLGREFDLVQSLETAEHIDERFADAFIDNLCRHGRLVMFSAAVPGQGGEAHANEQHPEYWRRRFLTRGLAAYDWPRGAIRGLSEIEPWYRYNVLLFATGDAALRLPPEVRATRLDPGAPVPNIAPLSWRMRNACLRCLPGAVVHRIAILKHRAMNLVATDAGREAR
jgi:SAM-dependent methyltransferase